MWTAFCRVTNPDSGTNGDARNYKTLFAGPICESLNWVYNSLKFAMFDGYFGDEP